ncbi:hypothetical protein SDC9_148314 [bioreactor metagenome]|uniref:Uncharacterized protein n=1 Tax=bioreactor metagenome TaxID=1076179 RepID=A0A645EGR2_9ZZZZ
MTFSVRSSSEVFRLRISPSIRARAIDSSPASLTRRSTRSARTRSIARWPPLSPSPSASAVGVVATSGVADVTVAGSAAGAASTAGAGPLRSSSAASARASQPASISSISCGLALPARSASWTRVSSRWVASPRFIAPAIRELPLKVCNRRAIACGGAPSAGAARQARSCSVSSRT